MSAGLVAAFGLLVSTAGVEPWAIGLGLLTCAVRRIFGDLEKRTKQLVKISEIPLKNFENEFADITGYEFKMLQKADDDNQNSYGKTFEYSLIIVECFAFVQIVTGVTFLLILNSDI